MILFHMILSPHWMPVTRLSFRGAGGSPAQSRQRQDVPASRLHRGAPGLAAIKRWAALRSAMHHRQRQRAKGYDKWFAPGRYDLRRLGTEQTSAQGIAGAVPVEHH